MNDRIALIDSSGFIWRAFFATPAINSPDGLPVNGVLGFCSMLTRMIQRMEITHIGAFFDAGHATFRREIFPGYKGNRKDPPADLTAQMPLFRDAIAAMGIEAVELPNFEADDLIASYAVHASVEHFMDAIVVSSDKDFMQLLDRERYSIHMFDPIKKREVSPDHVMAKFGVTPAQMIDFQAIMGDSVDNVPGVHGVGEKGAAFVLSTFGSLDNALAASEVFTGRDDKALDAVRQQAASALLSRELVTLRTNIELPKPISSLVRRFDLDVFEAFLDQHGILPMYQALMAE